MKTPLQTRAFCLCLLLLIGSWQLVRPAVASQTRTDQKTDQAQVLEEAERLSRQGSDFYWKGKFADAIPPAERALAIRENVFGPDHPLVATSLDLLAQIYHDMGDLTRAEPLHRRALATAEKVLGPKHPLVATLLSHLARLHEHRSHKAEAESLYRRALTIREKALGPEHPDVGTALYDLAGVSETDVAEPLYLRSLSIFEKAVGLYHAHVATVLNALGVRYYNLGNYARAEPLLKRALAIRETALDPEHPFLAQSLNNMAALYEEMGELARAEPLYQRALAIEEKALGPDHPGVATDLDNLAVLYQAKGDFDLAEPLHLRALAIREKAFGPEHWLVAGSLNNLGVLYEAKRDFERAEPLIKRALFIFEKVLGPDDQAVSTALNSLGLLYKRKGDLAKAEPLYQRAVSIDERTLGADHPETATSLNNLAVLYNEKGKSEQAKSLHQRALAIREKSLGPNHPDVAQSLDNLSVLAEAKGDYSVAVQLRSRGEAVEERNLSLILATGSERQKLAYVATLVGPTDNSVSLHARLAPTDTSALQLSLTTILRRKGRVLDAMTDQIASLRLRLNPEDRQMLDELSEVQSKLSALARRGPGNKPVQEYQAARSQIETKVEQLQDLISRRSNEFKQQTRPLTIEQVRQAIPPAAALVEFFSYRPFDPKKESGSQRFGSSRYVVYVLPKTGDPLWADLGEAAGVDGDIRRLLLALRCPQTVDDIHECPAIPAVKRLARIVDQRVMRPVRKLLDDTRHILIAPDGALNLLPFAALVDESDKYLVETYSLTYLTSGRDLLRLQSTAKSREPPVIVADPAFDEVGRATLSTRRPSSQRRSIDLPERAFSPLHGTAAEARALAALLPDARVLTLAQATESAVKQVERPYLLHIATHGFFLEDQPEERAELSGSSVAVANNVGPRVGVRSENPLLRSGLALARANLPPTEDNEDDGILTALETAGIDLWGTKLVVLSACETGIGSVRNGEGVYGLRRALVLAGSESQVMSLWQVSDEATRGLMVGYYKRLLAGEGRTEALRQVQLEFLHNTHQDVDPQATRPRSKKKIMSAYSHPYYWAAFIQSGDWRSMKPKPPLSK